MTVVCDTNVIISGLLFGGHCRDILRLASEGRLHVCISSDMLAELEEVLLRPKFGLLPDHVLVIVSLIRETFHTVATTHGIAAVIEDPDDNAVIKAAAASRADIIISGDRHLLALGGFRAHRILTPARFMAEFNAR